MINPIETIQIYSQLKPYSQRRKVEKVCQINKTDNQKKGDCYVSSKVQRR